MKRLFLLSIIIITFSCKDIMEEDISGANIEITYPTDNLSILSNIIPFQWTNVKGADQYRLQVFYTSEQKVLDTLVENTEFNQELSTGQYYCRVKAENFAYETGFSEKVFFTVDLTQDLSLQNVILETPENQIYLNDATNILLTWTELSAATSYDLTLDKEINGRQTILTESGLQTNYYQLPENLLSDDATYYWRIRAVNIHSQTVFSEFSFYLDRLPPTTPVLVSPINNASGTDLNIDFSWQASIDQGNIQSNITYKLEISDDINFTNPLAVYTTSDIHQTHNFAQSGVYFWRVISFDQANNYSSYSQIYQLTIN